MIVASETLVKNHNPRVKTSQTLIDKRNQKISKLKLRGLIFRICLTLKNWYDAGIWLVIFKGTDQPPKIPLSRLDFKQKFFFFVIHSLSSLTTQMTVGNCHTIKLCGQLIISCTHHGTTHLSQTLPTTSFNSGCFLGKADPFQKMETVGKTIVVAVLSPLRFVSYTILVQLHFLTQG